MEKKTINKKIIIGIVAVLFIVGGVFAWQYFRPEKPTIEEANAILAESNQKTLALNSFTTMGDINFQIKDKETVLLRVTSEDMRISAINPFNFANQDSSMTTRYNVMINFQAIIDRVKGGMTPEELEGLKEPIPMMGISSYKLMTTMRALGEANISVAMEMKTIDFNSYTKIVEVAGLREIITQVGGMFLAEMIMGGMEPYLGIWRKTPADPIAIEKMTGMFEKIERLIPTFNDAVYVKEVLPNTRVNGMAVYNFVLGINSGKLKDVVISIIPLISERDEMELLIEDKEKMKTTIIEAWPKVVQIIEAMNIDSTTYIDQRTRFRIRDTGAININLYDFVTLMRQIALEQEVEVTPEEIAEFERLKNIVRNMNIVMTANFTYNEHNAVPAIVPPAEYEVVEPEPMMPPMRPPIRSIR